MPSFDRLARARRSQSRHSTAMYQQGYGQQGPGGFGPPGGGFGAPSGFGAPGGFGGQPGGGFGQPGGFGQAPFAGGPQQQPPPYHGGRDKQDDRMGGKSKHDPVLAVSRCARRASGRPKRADRWPGSAPRLPPISGRRQQRGGPAAGRCRGLLAVPPLPVPLTARRRTPPHYRPHTLPQVDQGPQPQGEAVPGHRRRRHCELRPPAECSAAARSLPLFRLAAAHPLGTAHPLQALLLLWFVVEDHDTLFILSESVHFLGIGVLAWKLIKKKAAGGAAGGAARRGAAVVADWRRPTGAQPAALCPAELCGCAG